jgi:hypothetical protein
MASASLARSQGSKSWRIGRLSWRIAFPGESRFLANRAALVSTVTADPGLDLVERGNALECLVGAR